MSLAAKSLLLIAVLGLAACNNPDRYGAGGPGGAGGVVGKAGGQGRAAGGAALGQPAQGAQLDGRRRDRVQGGQLLGDGP